MIPPIRMNLSQYHSCITSLLVLLLLLFYDRENRQLVTYQPVEFEK